MAEQQLQNITSDIQTFSSLERLNKLIEGLTAEKFHKLVSYPVWNFIAETCDYTRSYEQGLEFGLKLLGYAKTFEGDFSKEEQEEHYRNLYTFMLCNLDKLDKWEEYLETWENIRANTNLAMKYSKRIKDTNESANEGYFEPIESYVLSEDETAVYVHFLYWISNRRKIIRRKLQRKQAGKKLGNLFHAKQEQLTDEQLRERFEHIRRKAKFLDEIELVLQRIH